MNKKPATLSDDTTTPQIIPRIFITHAQVALGINTVHFPSSDLTFAQSKAD